MKTVVLAPSYQRFVWWCRENQLRPTDPSLVYVGDGDYRAESRLQGLNEFKLVDIGGRPVLGVLQYLQYLRSEGRIVEDPVV